MERKYPSTKHMRTAVVASLRVQAALAELGIICFEWPQSMDTGIDLVAFATYAGPSDEYLRATAFTAGVQVKGTKKAFSKKATSRRIYIQQHSDYWQMATMPVFVISVSNETQEMVVEDAWSLLATQQHLSQPQKLAAIPASISVDAAGEHIRMRMMAHALAPLLSPRLRSRTLAELSLHPGSKHLESVWKALATCSDRYSSFISPRSWNEAQQTFELTSHMLQDASMRQAFILDAIRVRDFYRQHGLSATTEEPDLDKDLAAREDGSPTVLVGAIEMFHKLGAFQTDRQIGPFRGRRAHHDDNGPLSSEVTGPPERSYQRAAVDGAIDVIADMWDLTCTALEPSDIGIAEFLTRSSHGLRAVASETIETLAKSCGTDQITRALKHIFIEKFEPDFETRHW